MSGLRLSLAAAGMALLAPVPAPARAPAENPDPRCEPAVTYVQAVLARPSRYRSRLVFSTEPFDPIDFLESGWWVEGSDPAVHAPAPADLLARQSEGRRSAVPACPALRQLLAARGIAWGRRAVRAAQASSGRLRDDARVLIITLPVLSDDGRTALLSFSHSGAGASRLLMERQGDGTWRVVAYQPLAVY